MKILSNKKYNSLQDEILMCKEKYVLDTASLKDDNQDYELKINEINNKLKDILNLNSKTSKAIILGQIKGVVKFIEKGK